jgi:hypothetical protein
MALAVDFDESTDNEVDHPKTDRWQIFEKETTILENI